RLDAGKRAEIPTTISPLVQGVGRDEEATPGADEGWAHPTVQLALRSTCAVRTEEGWNPPYVHRLPYVECSDSARPLPIADCRRPLQPLTRDEVFFQARPQVRYHQ